MNGHSAKNWSIDSLLTSITPCIERGSPNDQSDRRLISAYPDAGSALVYRNGVNNDVLNRVLIPNSFADRHLLKRSRRFAQLR